MKALSGEDEAAQAAQVQKEAKRAVSHVVAQTEQAFRKRRKVERLRRQAVLERHKADDKTLSVTMTSRQATVLQALHAKENEIELQFMQEVTVLSRSMVAETARATSAEERSEIREDFVVRVNELQSQSAATVARLRSVRGSALELVP